MAHQQSPPAAFAPFQIPTIAPDATFREVRLILGDQLNHQHSWFRSQDPSVVYVLIEARSETDYVRHHIQKVIAFMKAMRTFGRHLSGAGQAVQYYTLDDPANQTNLVDTLSQLIDQVGATHWAYQLPDEYRVDQELKGLADGLRSKGIECVVADTEHFLTTRTELSEMFGSKSYLMERFYRKMRSRYNVLMELNGKDPLSGQWNYDADNRKKFDHKVMVPTWPAAYENKTQSIAETQSIEAMLAAQGVETVGRMPSGQHLDHPTTRVAAVRWLSFFVDKCLPHFGTYEDAMDGQHLTLFHSRLSFALNVKLLHPLEVVRAVETAYHRSQETAAPITLAQAEGFVRQVIGWREYMRGVYWAKMPDFGMLNFFGHKADLPQWYWTGKTQMNCMSHAINASLDHAYAHHIQRLMLTGSFALLLGVHPDQVDAWYLGVYIDALEWVMITNTRGMSQYADGGIVGTKPYVSAAAYIDKMSNYCSGCYYDKKKRHGDRACPFNSLYWDFYHRHEALLAKNPRIGMAYMAMRKFEPEELQKVLTQASIYKVSVNEL